MTKKVRRDEIAEIMRPAFAIDGEFDPLLDHSDIPEDGYDYLRRVR